MMDKKDNRDGEPRCLICGVRAATQRNRVRLTDGICGRCAPYLSEAERLTLKAYHLRRDLDDDELEIIGKFLSGAIWRRIRRADLDARVRATDATLQADLAAAAAAAVHARPAVFEPCFRCQKDVRVDVEHHVVHVVDGGARVTRPGETIDYDDPGEMGLLPVGPDCARKYRAEGAEVIRYAPLGGEVAA